MKRLLGMVGLCMKAGKLVSGEGNSIEVIRKGRARLVLFDDGISGNGRKTLENACDHRNIPIFSMPNGILGRAIGKPERMCLVITDTGFAESILKIISELQSNSGVH